MKSPSSHWFDEQYHSRFLDFQNLMRFRIRNVLLVSSLYDSYIIEEDAQLYEQIRSEYEGLQIAHTPEIRHVSTGAKAIALAIEERQYDLIITTMHIEDMHALELARRVRESGLDIPIVLLALDQRELSDILSNYDTSVFERIFLWQGDFRLIIAVLNYIEDRKNVASDSILGVQSILLVEDNVRFYSSYLPNIYTEVLKHSQQLIAEGINLSHRFLRMRARPKILLATNYDEAFMYFKAYRETILGVISDIDFQRDNIPDPEAGLELTREVKAMQPDVPVLLQSTLPENRAKALALNASFVLKDSPNLLKEVRQFMRTYFSFGDFVFRTPDGVEVGRATDLKSLSAALHTIPDESLKFHSERNHFSNWLKARTEFGLAHRLRPRSITDYPSLGALRHDLIASLHTYREEQERGRITDFVETTFDPSRSFARIGGGSLGGKARGLGFVHMLLNTSDLAEKFDDVRISVPPGVVVGTDVFDWFVERNGLADLIQHPTTDEETIARFMSAKKFPRRLLRDLGAFVNLVQQPLAVRSSSLQEDSQYQPFAGIYETCMIPNNHPNPRMRLRALLDAVKRVYASTYCKAAREYTRHTTYRLEEEKMAVVIQKIVGAAHADRFYPDFAGVAKSFNFYPIPGQQATDGTASVALGLGKTIVDGGASVTFCPRDPAHSYQYSSMDEVLAANQHNFFAIDLQSNRGSTPLNSQRASDLNPDLTRTYTLEAAEKDGTLTYVGSTYSPENDSIHDGLSRAGVRLVTFAPILKHDLVPLAGILDSLLSTASAAMGTPVEMEFAVTMSVPSGSPREFGVLQMRPLVVNRQVEEMRLEKVDPGEVLCESNQVLGDGSIDDIYDIVTVDPESFDRSKAWEVVAEIEQFNARLTEEKRPYLLIGMGRWGTLDPWLGIPVRWEQISGAKTIIEAGFKDFSVDPSQGSHFFQNLTVFMVGYFTINETKGQGKVDWEWLKAQKPIEKKAFTHLLRFTKPLAVRMNGYKQKGVIIKPGA
jgi:CheY-like chemotaxis protein